MMLVLKMSIFKISINQNFYKFIIKQKLEYPNWFRNVRIGSWFIIKGVSEI